MQRLTPRRVVLVVLLACAGLLACLLTVGSSRPAQAAAVASRYQIQADGGNAWMVDSATGRVWFCDEGACRELPVTGLHPRPSR
jgi:hypothetical protein